MAGAGRRASRPRKSKTYIELEGQQDIRNAFAKLELSALRECKKVIADSAAEIETEAKARCPVSEPSSKSLKNPYPSGTTRASIKTIIRDFGLNATVGSGWFVARFIEQGVRDIPAKPFMNPAFQIVRPKFLDRLGKALGLAAKEAAA